MPPKQLTIEDKLFLVNFRPDETSHLVIKDQAICRDQCECKYCTVFCPSDVYRWEEKERKLSVAHEDCFECGACRIGCPYNNIEWRYPRGGFGVQYKYG